MSDVKLTKENMETYSGEQTGFLKTAAQLEEFGKNQNAVNTAILEALNSISEKLDILEQNQEKHREVLKRIAAELSNTKRELDRIKLSVKLNTGAVARIDKAIRENSGQAENEVESAEADESNE